MFVTYALIEFVQSNDQEWQFVVFGSRFIWREYEKITISYEHNKINSDR